MKFIVPVLLGVSVFVNVGLAMALLDLSMKLKPEEKYGVLMRGVQIGPWNDNDAKPFASLPAGITVQNASDVNQMGQFEPYRFSIIITSDKELVDYSAELTNPHTSYYTADGWK